MFKKIRKLPGFIRGLKKISDVESRLFRTFADKFRSPSEARGSAPLVLVQCVEDPYFLGLFGQIISSLRNQGPVRVEQFVLRSVTTGESEKWWQFIGLRLVANRALNQKWTSLYASFCNSVGYSSAGFDFLISDFINLFHAYFAWKSLSDRESLMQFCIADVHVGDLISDTFLRFKPAPTVEISDGYLFLLIWQAYCDVHRAQTYFSRSRVSLYLTSYSTYIQHGIPVRVALRENVEVFSFGNYQEFAKRLLSEDWMHTRDASGYAEHFSRLDSQAEKLDKADLMLSERLAGGRDAATAYMKQSAYRETEEMTADVRGAVVIFLHDFFDSPNVYYDMVFPDFWQWACFTIDILTRADIPFVVKPHPNQIGMSGEVIDALKRRYPTARFISSKITNKQLVDGQVICAVTAYGTVAHEMAYLGIPSITCARHPHIAFDFCITAKTVDEYEKALISSVALEVDRTEMSRQSLIFYYMHNLGHSPDTLRLLELTAQFRARCAAAEAGAIDATLPDVLDNISSQPGFQAWISTWRKILVLESETPSVVSG